MSHSYKFHKYDMSMSYFGPCPMLYACIICIEIKVKLKSGHQVQTKRLKIGFDGTYILYYISAFNIFKKMASMLKESQEVATSLEMKLLSLKQTTGTPTMQVTSPKQDDDDTQTQSPPIFKMLLEIWDVVFPYLTPTDFHSMINTCSKWREIFKSETVNRLLPLWLPIFVQNCGFNNIQEFLRWRGVSREAKSLIDNMLETSVSPAHCFENLTTSADKWSPDVEVEDRKESLRRVTESIKSRYIFKDASNIRKFIYQMNDGHSISPANRNPFLAKSLTIPLGGLTWFPENPDENRELNELTMSLVSSHGHGISTISLIIWGELSIPLLFGFLSHLPNLKVLEMQGEFPLEARHAEEIAIWENQVYFQNLELLNLGVFSERHDEDEVDHFRETGGILASLLRRCGSQLKRFVCTAEFFEWESNIREINVERFPHLSFLRVRLIDWEFFDRLVGLAGLPLEVIELAVNKYRSDYCPSIDDVLNSLITFRSTLTHLQLCIPLMGEPNLEDYGGFVVLPNLTKFTTSLDCNYSMWSSSFIRMQGQQLTELVLIGEEEDVDFDEEECNQLKLVFQMVPNLEKIAIRCGFYSNPYSCDEAEMAVVERDGQIKRVKFKPMSYYK